MHVSQLTHVRVCERVTVFYVSSRDLTQNSTSPALGAEVRLESVHFKSRRQKVLSSTVTVTVL